MRRVFQKKPQNKFTKLQSKIQEYLRFSLNHKLPKMIRRKSDEEIVELYQIYSTLAFSSEATPQERAQGWVMVSVIETVLKNRYPHNLVLRSWDFSIQRNLQPLIKKGKR